jgi:hypothetical protein
MTRQAMEYFIEHQSEFRSKDAAAEPIAGKVVPVAFRTVRDWLKESPNK